MDISKKVKEISPSLTLENSAKAKKMKSEGISVVGFTAGELDFDTPKYIKEGAQKAILAGFTKYTPASGTLSLRNAICDKLKKDNGLEYCADQIVVSSGAKTSLYLALSTLINEGDEVIIPSPYWLTYPELVGLVGGKSVFLDAKKENGYKITSKELEEVITEKTKCLILNTPCNPTGAVYKESELRAIAEVVERKGLYVISDEIYEKLRYDGERNFSIAEVNSYMKEHTVIINGVSKTYSMTGWRIGFSASSLPIAKAISSMQSHVTGNACSISQYASESALTDRESSIFIENMVKTMENRRNLMTNALNEIEGVSFAVPEGAFYVFLDVSAFYGKFFNGKKIDGSLSFAELILDQGVALIPGVAFGEDKCVRLSYAVSEKDIIEGVNRIKLFLSKLR